MRIGIIIECVIWSILFILLLLALFEFAHTPYPAIGREPGDEQLAEALIYLFTLVMLGANFLMAAISIGIRLYKKRKIILPLITITLAFALFFIALCSPFYLVYFYNAEHINNLKIRADYRASEGNWEQAMDIYCFIDPRVLNPNPNIRRIQEWLSKSGYYNNAIDGRADNKIIEQLRVLQKDYKLVPDGRVGSKTKSAIFNQISKTHSFDSTIKSSDLIEIMEVDYSMFLQKYSLINKDFYIIPYSTMKSEAKAKEIKTILEEEKKLNSGYLWISDFMSLSNELQYVIYIGPFATETLCKQKLIELKNEPGFSVSYGLLVSKHNQRKEIRIE